MNNDFYAFYSFDTGFAGFFFGAGFFGAGSSFGTSPT
jgi:hypothetical protein